ncbi:aspartyl protease family protein 2-like [Phragmites australis]|uniref:aspartyl protease family protein 2-like n=1 Tax=Phragmites australis TaxID=29695 RepID=UPI002D7A280D|nr:aspartyl protease family protein 2-like [Phragmites australis]
MALSKLFLVLFCITSNAIQPPRTLHVPVVHRDAVFPPTPGATPSTLFRRRHATDAARYTALNLTAHDRLHSPVLSGHPFDSGEYFALLGVGTPSTRALVVIDTGSDLVWLQCIPCRHCYGQLTPLYDPRSSRTYRQIPFSSPRCHELKYPGCDSRGGCTYTIVYGDGSSSRGEIATDRLVFSNDTHVHNVALGCGHDNEGLFDSAAGLLGVGRGTLSFPTQLKAAYGHVFAYCLGDRTSRARSSSSYLVFGRTPELPSTVFTPLLTNPRLPNLYYVDMVGFSVDGERVTRLSNANLALDAATGRGGVVVDSGTAISQFARDADAAVRDAFDARAAATGMRKLAKNLSVFDACYDLRGSGIATARVPTIALHFAGGADMVLPMANSLVQVDGSRRRTYYCLGLKASDDELNVLGNVQQQGFRLVFDMEGKDHRVRAKRVLSLRNQVPVKLLESNLKHVCVKLQL